MTEVVDDPAEPADDDILSDATFRSGDEHRDEHLGWYQEPVTDHPAATVLLVGLVVSFPVLVFSMASSRWFYLDEWDFLTTRRATNLGDLFRPHNENMSTIPVLIYRAVFSLFRLHSYWPYVVPVVLAHLCVVGLLWIIMRRSGVNQWVALLTVGLLAFFGAGYSDIVWGFQIGFTGALAFGLAQMILADHDGPLDRRDGLALAAGVCALLCSVVGVVLVAAVGLACLLRRGWRAAAFHTVPLAIAYLIWTALAKPDSPLTYGRSTTYIGGQIFRWDVASFRFAFTDLGHYAPVGVALGVIVVVGLALTWIPMGRDLLRRQNLIVATLVGAVLFDSISGLGRWFFGPDASGASRYVYLTVALVSPALGVAAGTLIHRWRPLAPVVVLVMLVGVPGNVGAFNRQFPSAAYAKSQPQLVAALGQSPLISRDPPSALVEPVSMPWLTAGWLAQAHRQGWLPNVAISSAASAQVPAILGLIQSVDTASNGAHCQKETGAVTIRPAQGSSFWVLYTPQFSLTLMGGADGKVPGPSRLFTASRGSKITVELPDAIVRVKGAAGFTSLMLCR